ncbi:MAG: helix-turn-helix domain-containing protein [Clostridia bacterium]|jgi:two-component system response regulator YesN
MHIDGTYQKMVDEIKEYITENFQKQITLNDLSGKYYLSSSYLSKIFKEVTGVNFTKYLYTYRINRAKELLQHSGDRPIREICSFVGFNDVCYFYRVFRKVEGTTPTDYKLRIKRGRQVG